MEQSQKVVKNLIIFLLVVLAFIFTLTISSSGDLSSFFKAFGSQILFLLISFLVYASATGKPLGIERKTLGSSILFGIVIGIIYVIVTSIFPFLAIATPLVPNAIGSGLKFFLIVVIAPIVETIFFLGALLGYIRLFQPSEKRIWVAIIIQAILFALFHLGTYIVGLYDLPNITAGFLGFTQNISVFISAMIYGLLSGFLVTRKQWKGLVIAIIVHLIINAFVYSSKAIMFAG